VAEDDDDEARRRRAAQLRAEIEEAVRRPADARPPTSPREFTDRRAREAAAERPPAEEPPDEGGEPGERP
jgi:hypothetical protein